MKTVVFILLMFVPFCCNWAQKLKVMAMRGETWLLKSESDEYIDPDSEGYFIKEFDTDDGLVCLRIARFRVLEVNGNEIKAQALAWGRGWDALDVNSARIFERQTAPELLSITLVEEGIEFFRENEKQKARDSFLRALDKDKNNQAAVAWLNKIQRIDLLKVEELNTISPEIPDEIKHILPHSHRVEKNSRGFWEAVLTNELTFIFIPSGRAVMGSDSFHENEEPQHFVEIDSFWIAKYELSFSDFDKYCAETGTKLPFDYDFGRNDLPVVGVSWQDAMGYCGWLSQKYGFYFSLPSEAQWEKAARGPDGRRYPWGDHHPIWQNEPFANLLGTEDGFIALAPVSAFYNGISYYGVFNMSGNVAEWTLDWFAADYTWHGRKLKNPSGPLRGKEKVVKGGSFLNHDFLIRPSARKYLPPSEKNDYTGFRLVINLE